MVLNRLVKHVVRWGPPEAYISAGMKSALIAFPLDLMALAVVGGSARVLLSGNCSTL